MKAPVGIEINSELLKIVTVKPYVRQQQLSDCFIKSITGLSDKEISAIIADYLRETKIKPKPLIVSLPRNLVTLRNIHLPSQDENEIKQMLELHVGRMVPYRREEVVFDYSIAGYDEMRYAKLILAIVHNDVLKRQLNILHSADLFIDRINLSTYGVWGWVMLKHKSEINSSDIYLAIDLDSSFADFIIFKRDNILFSRSITVDVKDDFAQMQVSKLIAEIRQFLVIFHNEEMNKNPAKIYLCGATLVGRLCEMIVSELDIPTEVVAMPCPKQMIETKKSKFFENVSLTAVSQFLFEDNAKNISFTLPEIQIRKALKDKTRDLTILGALLIYLLSAVLAYSWSKFYNQQLYLNKLREYNKKIDEEMGELVTKFKRLDLVKNFIWQRRMPVFFIYELYKITPPQVAFNYLNIDDSGTITLRGQSVMLSDAFKFVSTIESSKYFKNVTTKYTRTKKLQNREFTEFEITFKSEVPVEGLK